MQCSVTWCLSRYTLLFEFWVYFHLPISLLLHVLHPNTLNYYLFPLIICPKFKIGSKPKSLSTSIGAVLFTMIWLSHPCIWKTNFWFIMAFTVTLTMTSRLNVQNVSMHTMSSAFKNQISAPTINMSVHLWPVDSSSKFMLISLYTFSVLLIFIWFHSFLFRMGCHGKKPPPAWTKTDSKRGESLKHNQRMAVTQEWMTQHLVRMHDMAAAIQEYHE